MKDWLKYIVFFVLGMLGTACQQDELLEVKTDLPKVEVQLQFSFPGAERALTKGFVDGGTDSDTPEQMIINSDDIYVLVLQKNNIIAQVKNLTFDTGRLMIKGSFNKPANNSNQIQLIVLTNLRENFVIPGNIKTRAEQTDVQKYLDTFTTLDELQTNLLYRYQAMEDPDIKTNPYGIWDIGTRKIPMWGVTDSLPIKGKGKIKLDTNCTLHRAVAKMGFIVNNGKGYSGFWIEAINITNVRKQGCIVPSGEPINGYFKAPSLPVEDTKKQEIKLPKRNFNDTQMFVNQIYLPEHKQADNLQVEIIYHLSEDDTVDRKINFTFDAEDIIRNHSYVFNLIKQSGDVTVAYKVVDWEAVVQNLTFGNADGKVLLTDNITTN